MFRGTNWDAIQDPPKYSDLDEHVNTPKEDAGRLGTGSGVCNRPTNVKQNVVETIRALIVAKNCDTEWKNVVSKRNENEHVRKLLVLITETLQTAIDDFDDSDDGISSDLVDSDDDIHSGSESDGNRCSNSDSNSGSGSGRDSEYHSDENDGNKVAKKSKQSAKKSKKKVHEDDGIEVAKKFKKMVQQHKEMKIVIKMALRKTAEGESKLQKNFGVDNPEEYPVTDDDEKHFFVSRVVGTMQV